MSHNETLSEKRENISTPTPWEIGHQLGDGFSITHEIAPNCGRLVCIATAHNTCAWSGHMSDDIAKANRDLIIKAVNSHEALCTAAELLADVREAFLDAIDRGDSDGSVTEIMRGFLAGDVIADALEAVEAQIKI